jgi:hypothetical protein
MLRALREGGIPEMARDVTAALDVPAVDVRRLLVGADLVKLDVEGQEHALLATGRDLLRERRRAHGSSSSSPHRWRPCG